MKGCELCSYPAKMYCESDQASLCWECDEKVHSANFLVAKHTRGLLCHVCQCPTPWKASGPKLGGPTVSVCDTCVRNCNIERQELRAVEREEGSQGHSEDDDEEDVVTDDDGAYGDSDDDEEEDGENQVVPWSSTLSPPPVASSSSSEQMSSTRLSAGDGGGVSASKRMRENADLDTEDDIGCSSSRFNHKATSLMAKSSPGSDNVDEATSSSSFRPLKLRRANELIGSHMVGDHGEAESRTAAILSSLKRFQQHMISGEKNNASATILGIRKLGRDP